MADIPMKKVRLKEDCPYVKMVTSYGIITRDWLEVQAKEYVFKEMEVEGQKEEPKEEPVVKEVPIPRPFGKKKRK